MPTRPEPRAGVDPCPAIQWIGWHLGELTAVAVPTLLAVTVWAWLAVVAVLLTLGWICHEIGLHRRRRALAAGRTHPAVTATPGGREGQASA